MNGPTHHTGLRARNRQRQTEEREECTNHARAFFKRYTNEELIKALDICQGTDWHRDVGRKMDDGNMILSEKSRLMGHNFITGVNRWVIRPKEYAEAIQREQQARLLKQRTSE